MDIILASTSHYRRVLLNRLGISYRSEAPDVDETPGPGETPEALARRLATAKARVVARKNPNSLVIGSDQVAALGDRLLGKPGSHEAAMEQLCASSGREVRFYTGLALICEHDEIHTEHVEEVIVEFRALERDLIDNYLRREQPYDCAGSFKCEGLGIALFRRIRSEDPTSLEGLPLIALTSMLTEAGAPPLLENT